MRIRITEISMFWIIVISFMITFYVSIYNNLSDVESLSNLQKSNLARELSFKGYENMHRIGCDKAMTLYISTGEWMDSNCASKYAHIKRSVINAS